MKQSSSLSWMVVSLGHINAQSKAEVAAQRQLDRSTAANASNASPPPRSAGECSAEQG